MGMSAGIIGLGAIAGNKTAGKVTNFAEGLFGFGPDGNKSRRERGLQSALDASKAAADAFAPPVIPPLPDVKKQNTDAGLAMTQAALAQRKKSASAGGFASTILSSPTGAPAAPTIRKQALGV